MGYRQQRRRLSTRDVPDPKLFRDQAQPAVEEVAGNLNEHNLVGGDRNNPALASNRYTPAMIYDFHFAQRNSDPHIADSGTFFPTGGDAQAHRVSDSGEWEVLEHMTLQYTEGEHTAWCIGFCQYGVVPAAGTYFSLNTLPLMKPRAQFAIRVNGTIIEETIPGTERPDEGAPSGVRPVAPVLAPGTEHFQRSLDYATARSTGSMNWHVKPVRIQCQVQVPQGETTVEFMVRRVIADGLNTTSSVAPPLYVWNRQIVDVVMKLGGTDASTEQDVAVVYPEDADALDAAHTKTNILDPLVTSMNALGSDAVVRHGLRNEHLPLPGVRDYRSTKLISGNNNNNVYPGWGNAGVVGASPNWQYVQNGAGANLVADPNDGSGFWDFATSPGFVLVFANIAFSNTQAAGASYNTLTNTYGVFSIGTLYSDGTTSLQQRDQVFVNNPNAEPAYNNPMDFSANECPTDVPLFAYFDFRTVPPAKAVSEFRALVSLLNHTRVDWERSSIFSLIFRP